MKKMYSWLKGLMGLAALVAFGLVGLAACQSQETELSFETVERADSAGTGEYYTDEDPKLVVIAQTTEIDALGNTISLEAQTQLQALDFDRYFVIAVFQGWRPQSPTPRSGAEVEKVSQKGNTITTYAHFYEPVAGYERKQVVISPYHLIKVQREKEMRGEIEFVLNVDGMVTNRQTHRLP